MALKEGEKINRRILKTDKVEEHIRERRKIKMTLKQIKENFKIIHKKDILVEVEWNIKEEQTESGIIISTSPSLVENRPNYGIVIQKGKEVSDEINIGDKVFWDKVSGIDLYLDEKEKKGIILLNEERIIGKEI